MAKHVVVSLSGGMDSSTLLLRALSEFDTVTAVSFDYGQKHRVELERAQALVDYINSNFEKPIEVNGETVYATIRYRQIKLDGLSALLNSALVTGGDEVPEGHYAAENMKATVVPNRNKIFSSITQAIALSIANETKEECPSLLASMPETMTSTQTADRNSVTPTIMRSVWVTGIAIGYLIGLLTWKVISLLS
jgi:7-cyano-7-deazaguanine synthase